MENPLDHVFSTYQVNIMQSCDQCNSYIEGMEKVYICSCEYHTDRQTHTHTTHIQAF